MTKAATNSKLSVVARSPFHVYYEGEAEVVSASNRIGDFDVLPGHADFFSVMEAGTVIIGIGPDQEPITFQANNGIITVRDDQVLLFANW